MGSLGIELNKTSQNNSAILIIGYPQHTMENDGDRPPTPENEREAGKKRIIVQCCCSVTK
jgi:hypothetical protein